MYTNRKIILEQYILAFVTAIRSLFTRPMFARTEVSKRISVVLIGSTETCLDSM